MTDLGDAIDEIHRDRIEEIRSQRSDLDLSPMRPPRIPLWLDKLLGRAGWDSYVLAVEIGENGRGVMHPTLGWVSVEELREVARRRAADDPGP